MGGQIHHPMLVGVQLIGGTGVVRLRVISITEEDKTIYIPVRRQTMELGIEEDQILIVGKFKATRDEQGEFNGEQWVVNKGNIKLFAY